MLFLILRKKYKSKQILLNVCNANLKAVHYMLDIKSCYSPGGIDEVYYKRCYTENEN